MQNKEKKKKRKHGIIDPASLEKILVGGYLVTYFVKFPNAKFGKKKRKVSIIDPLSLGRILVGGYLH